MELDKDLRSRQEVRDLVKTAAKAAQTMSNWDQTQADKVAKAIADAGMASAKELGELAYRETGFGNAADKKVKNEFASHQVWEAIKSLRTIGILAEHPQEKILDVGVPVGVIAGIVPSTNPTSTIIYKAQIALKAGNPIVFSPHPGALQCTMKATEIVRDAAEKAGCPTGAIASLPTPTMAAVEELMHHQDVKLILATGGPGMVKAAYSSGRPAIGVGAGNGPAFIHKSADITKAIRDIIRSKTFDNGTVCASEQSIIVESATDQAVRAELKKQGAHFLSEQDAKQLGKFLFRANGSMNPATVGKSAQDLAKLAGLSAVPANTTVLVAKETDAGPDFPYSNEKLCPALGYFVEPNEDAVLATSCKILHYEGSGHTFAIHATDDAVIRRFALRVPVSRFLVNTPAALGGIGATTNLFPALTLGCGAVGGSSSSNNIGPLDLINIRRVAWGVRDIAPSGGHNTTKHAVTSDALIDELVNRILQKLH